MRFDRDIPGRVKVGQTVTVAGTVTLTDRRDYDAICFEFSRYGAATGSEIFECRLLSGKRFSVPIKFTQKGTYFVQNFLFWPASGPQFPRSAVSTIVVD